MKIFNIVTISRERVQNTTRSRLEEANIGGLIPARVYIFRVVAFNNLGPGSSSKILKVVTQPEEHVPSSPLHIIAHATSPTSIHVSWKPPEITNGDIVLYKVYYMDVRILKNMFFIKLMFNVFRLKHQWNIALIQQTLIMI